MVMLDVERGMNQQQHIDKLRKLTWREEGQDLLEYGLLMSLIAIVAMTAVGTVGATVKAVFWDFIVENF